MISHQYLSREIKYNYYNDRTSISKWYHQGLKALMGNNIIIHLVRQRYCFHIETKGESKGQEHKLIIVEK
jgi:hypothetical protein